MCPDINSAQLLPTISKRNRTVQKVITGTQRKRPNRAKIRHSNTKEEALLLHFRLRGKARGGKRRTAGGVMRRGMIGRGCGFWGVARLGEAGQCKATWYVACASAGPPG